MRHYQYLTEKLLRISKFDCKIQIGTSIDFEIVRNS